MCFEVAQKNLESDWLAPGECKHYLLNFHYTPKIPKRPNTVKWNGVKDT